MRKNDKDAGNGSNQLPKDFINSLIKQNKSKVSKSPASSSTSHRGSNKTDKFVVTPKGILHKTLCDALGKDISIN